MTDMTDSYPMEHNFFLKELEKQLDEYFYDVYDCVNPVICDKKLLKIDPCNTNALKEQYSLEKNNVLRFDHTHLMLNGYPYIFNNLNVKNVGPVFRKAPSSGYRWKQFFQYDLDYVYENHQLRPLKVLIKALDLLIENDYEIKINDLSVLKKTLNESVIISEDNVKSLLSKTSLDIEKYKSEVLNGCSWLNQKKVTIDPTLVRGWNYYEDFVFEIHHKGVAFAGGGTYFNFAMSRKYFGLSIGLNRLLKILFSKNWQANRFKTNSGRVLIYNLTNELPQELLDRLELEKINYYLKSKKQNYVNDLKKIDTALKKVNKHITSIIFFGALEKEQKKYTCRSGEFVKSDLSLDQLIKILKT